MKTLLLFVCSTIISSLSFSQIKKGTSLVGGCFQVSTASSKDSNNVKTTNFGYTINPSYNYMLNEHWAAGLGIGYTGNGNKSTYDDPQNEPIVQKYSTGLFFIEPQVRYYHGWNDKLYCYGIGSINAGFGSTKIIYESSGSSSETKSKNSQFSVSIKPGFTYLFDKKLGLDLTYGELAYSRETSKLEDSEAKDTGSNFGLNMNFKTLTIGLVYLLNCSDEE